MDSSVYYTRCYVFIDDSNLWIEGQKHHARRLKLSDADHDPRYRVDLGKFLDLVVGKRSYADSFLYGSKPPPNDSVWKAARDKNFKVEVFDRAKGSPHGREKQVDVAMATQIAKSACKCDPGEKDNIVFIIVTGDRDFSSPVQCALDEGIQVELWAWKSGMAIHFRQLANKTALLTVKEIDDVAERFSFTAFRSTRARGDINAAHAIIFKGLDIVEQKFLPSDLLCLLRLFYITQLPSSDHNQQLQDIVVEFPNSKPEDVLKQLERYRLAYKAVSYPEYFAQTKYQPVEILMSNRYQVLGEMDVSDDETTAEAIACSLNLDVDDVDKIFTPKVASTESTSSVKGDGDHEVDVEDDDEEVVDDGDWEVCVGKKAGAKSRRHKLRETRCRWEIHCAKASACTYLHTEEEKELFKNYPQIKFQFWKIRPCDKTLRHSMKHCSFAHTDSDTWCLKCQSWGHSTDACAG